MTHILNAAAVSPPYEYHFEQVWPYMEKWLSKTQDELFIKKILRIYKNAHIKKRYSVLPIEEIFTETSFEEKNNLYIENSIKLASLAFEKSLEESRVDPKEISCIITTSCTGFMIPALDAHIINKFKLRQDILRLPILQMGCAGGTAGLIYADKVLSGLNGKAALLAVEIPTLTFQFNDFTMENMVSTAIFADGAASVILGKEERAATPKIIDTQMFHFPESTTLMGFALKNTGLKIILEKEVPDEIEKNFSKIVDPFLQKNNLKYSEISDFIFHPGSIKILSKTEAILKEHGKNLDVSKQVLENHGNMSSVTVLQILSEHMKKPHKKGEYSLMLSFGPGFSGQTLLLKWN